MCENWEQMSEKLAFIWLSYRSCILFWESIRTSVLYVISCGRNSKNFAHIFDLPKPPHLLVIPTTVFCQIDHNHLPFSPRTLAIFTTGSCHLDHDSLQFSPQFMVIFTTTTKQKWRKYAVSRLSNININSLSF